MSKRSFIYKRVTKIKSKLKNDSQIGTITSLFVTIKTKINGDSIYKLVINVNKELVIVS